LVKEDLIDICAGIKAGRYMNEAPGPQEDVQRLSWRRSYNKFGSALRIRRQAIEAWLEKNEY
jgi:hypothetical protein